MPRNPIIQVVDCCANCNRRYKSNKASDNCPYLEALVGEDLSRSCKYAVCKFYDRDKEEFTRMMELLD